MKGHARNLMTDHVIKVQPDMSLTDIGRVLVAGHHGGLPVVDDDDRVIGIITEFDVLDAVLRGVPETTLVRDLMSHPVLVVDEFTTTDEVIRACCAKVASATSPSSGRRSWWASSPRTTY